MRRLGGLLLVMFLLGGASGAGAGAATIEPTRFDDPAPNGCKPSDCSLREAISRANNRVGRDTVLLGRGTYEIEIPETAGDNNKGGDFDVTDEVKILGRGVNRTTVDGGGVSRVFSLLTFPPKAIERLTVTGGQDSVGAGILSGPNTVSLRDVVVANNVATEDGGGIYTVSLDMKLKRASVRDNDAEIGGGGMYIPAGIVDVPQIAIRASTFSGNDAAIGAGVYLNGFNPPSFDDDPSASAVNSTFAGNQATVSGGGISVIQGSQMTLDNSTIAFNGADVDNSGGGFGGGIHQSSGAVVALYDSIVQGNTAGTSGGGRTCAGEFTMLQVVYSGQPAGTCSFLGGSTTQEELDPPKLGLLADHGGPTETIELLTGSAALGFADNGCPAKDQRGEPRPPVDCDAGAFEAP